MNQQRRKPGQKRSLWAALSAIGVFLTTQAKLILPLLKFGKAGGAIISMFVAIWAYALVAPFSFAVGLVVMILIHELGHVAAAKLKGLRVSAPVFIPFLGALITMKRQPRDAGTEAFIAFGGPILGTVGAVCAYGLGLALNSVLLVYIAYVGFYLNLFNLLPIHPLDGGRIATAVTRWLWVVGLLGGLAYIIYLGSLTSSFILILIWAAFAWNLYQKYVKYRNKEKVRDLTVSFEYDAEPLLQLGILLPGEEHRRELAFTTYSRLGGDADGGQVVDASWEAMGFKARIDLASQALIRRVQVVRVERLYKEERLHLIVHIQIAFTPYENDVYYDVSAATRWIYGTLYVGLALFLFYMIRQIHHIINI